MARYTGPSCRQCRREGMKLFLKGARCTSDRCALERRNTRPGERRPSRSKMSDYGMQLREKQKVKRMYGIMERQFRMYFERARRQKGITGESLLQILEKRLDNMVYRLGFGPSRSAARQMVRHGNVTVNGRKVDIPSYQVRIGDVIAVGKRLKTSQMVIESLQNASSHGVPPWLELDSEKITGKVLNIPTREEMGLDVNEQLIVELYSK